MKQGSLFLVALGVCLLFATAQADTFQQGDVFASVSSGSVQQWRDVAGTWTLIDTLTFGSGLTTGSAFDAAGNLYVTTFNNNRVVKYTGPNDPHVGSVFGTTDAGSNVESILFDAAGNVFVGQADGTRDILRLDSTTGAIVDRFNVATEARGTDWIDLASDQRTMYYTSEGRLIKRYDIVSNTQLADFATLPGPRFPSIAYGLRILADGGVIVADQDNIKRLNSAGAVIQTYDFGSLNLWFAVNLDPDGTSFWSGDLNTGEVHRFDIATGAHLAGFDTGNFVAGISVFGEITQGTGGQTVIPEPSTLALLAFAGVGFLAVRRRKRRAA